MKFLYTTKSKIGSKKTNRLKGSTIIEVIIALVIIMIVFGISFQIYLNLNGNNGNNQKIRAINLIQTMHNHTVLFSNFENSEIVTGQLILDKQVSKHPYISNILLIQYTAKEKNTNYIFLKKNEIVTY